MTALMKRPTWVVLVSVLLFLSFFGGTSDAGEVALVGPQAFVRTSGTPPVYSVSFFGRPGIGKLVVQNGDARGRVLAIAVIRLNGTQVVSGADFQGRYSSLVFSVALAHENTLTIEVRGEPDAHLTLTVIEDIACTAVDQCHVSGAWDRAVGACTNPSAPNGTTCGDGNACTQTDTCQNGVCQGSNPVICAALDQCHNVGTCNAATGVCSNPAKADATTCDDGNACTQTDACQSGVCQGSNPVACTALDQCHTVGTCDPATGACSNPLAASGTVCDDGNLCTQNDVCTLGACAGDDVTCNDSNTCTVDSCDPTAGCKYDDARLPITVSPTVTRYSVTDSDGRVSLYEAEECSIWEGHYINSNNSDCGPTAGLNVLSWYGVDGVTRSQLTSDMRTNEWMSFGDVVSACWCICSPFGCSVAEPACTTTCTLAGEGFDTIFDIGTHPDDLALTLKQRRPAGYQLATPHGRVGLDVFETILQKGDPIVVLLWTGSSLHWTVVTHTYNDGGTPMVGFANYTSKTWDWFVHQWSFNGINWPVTDILDEFGVQSYTWMHYEKPTRLAPGQMLAVGQENALYSQDGRFMFFLDIVGHLTSYPTPIELGHWLWHSPNDKVDAVARGYYAHMQTDGNLVLYDKDRHAIWATGTDGHPGAFLAIQSDGNLVIYDVDERTVLWSSHTSGH